MIITSTGNQYVRLLKSLHAKKGRAQHGLFLVEGVKLVQEALDAGLRLHSVAFSASALGALETVRVRAGQAGAPVHVLEDRVMSFAADVQTPQGVLAAVHMWDLALPENIRALPRVIVALERMQDPGNMGAIIRTAEAAGAGAAVLSPGCCEPFSPKVVRGAMGSVLRVRLYQAPDFPHFLRQCADAGYAVVAGALDGENVFLEHIHRDKFVLLIGNEASGLTEEALTCAAHRVRIPMAGRTESLNAGVAAGILLYELQREKFQKV
ncbi:MAG: TrmH family RNA methyltransferase [Bacillota bacterium]